MLRRGVPLPTSMRAAVWSAAAQTTARKGRSPRTYAEHVQAGLVGDEFADARYQIEQDLPRTMPEQPEFALNVDQDGPASADGAGSAADGRGRLIPSLERVLVALCASNPATGYCQVPSRMMMASRSSVLIGKQCSKRQRCAHSAGAGDVLRPHPRVPRRASTSLSP